MVVNWCSRSGDCSNSSGALRFITSSSNSAFELGMPYHVFGSPLLTLITLPLQCQKIHYSVQCNIFTRTARKEAWIEQTLMSHNCARGFWLETYAMKVRSCYLTPLCMWPVADQEAYSLHHVSKSVACLSFYNLKKSESIIIVFGTQYPDNPSF